jgi:glycosyltransferase involved in cell wall biosynthesis
MGRVMPMPKVGRRSDVTVVVPAYRAERTIRRTVDSLLAQRDVELHVIVVIDGSFDRTAEILADYPEDQVRVVSNDLNQGAARTRNAGLSLADSEFVMFVDADDFVEGRLIAALACAMQAANADVGFGPMQIYFEGEERRYPRFVPRWSSAPEIFHKWHGDEQYVNPTSVMWRTRFLREIGGWDPEISRNDDGELVMRAVLRGAQFITSDEGQGVYVKHSSETMNHRPDNMDSMLKVNRKLLAMQSSVVPEEEKRRACAFHYFNTACHAYLSGRNDLADEAWAASRAMGVSTRGPLHYRIGYAVLGPKRLLSLVKLIKRKIAL